ncbi:XdhC family protein [Pseudarthrobacter sp. NamE5]|uniref:XdhC family protein n=1 Tax=Pseudarthrobacter sp. NamE5 TaxID=2576839 RepID=UPI00110AE32C|nr:XdhC/CoxI family protein [Pseudarthrobacter sp. NamE5]TLM81828.1 XdhC family protein [Pseudarthrobacter sp. NamE5]
MLDLIPSLHSGAHFLGSHFAVATIVAASGSVPRPVGTSMIVTASGDVLGSLSGGCVEGAVVALAQEAMDDGAARRKRFGFSSANAFAAGLTCGGELDIHIEPVAPDAPGQAAHPLRTALHQLGELAPGEPVALVRRLGTPGGGAVVVREPADARAAELPELASLVEQGHSMVLLRMESILHNGGAGVVPLAEPGSCLPEKLGQDPQDSLRPALLVESRLAPPRMLVFGANDFGAALIPAAKLLGYRVTVVDARPAFTAQSRFAAADDVVTDWPHRYLAAESAAGRLDSRTVAAVLTHDPKFDLPLLEKVLDLDLAYVGAMGSRRSHLQRMEELLAAGVRPERIASLHSPIGLDIGAVTPAEVAVSITAEIVAARNRAASCTPLRDRSGPIHQHPARRQPLQAPATVNQQEIAWT